MIHSKLDYGCIFFGRSRQTSITYDKSPSSNEYGSHYHLSEYSWFWVYFMKQQSLHRNTDISNLISRMQPNWRLKVDQSNFDYDCVYDPSYENIFHKQPNTIKSFELRITHCIFGNWFWTAGPLSPMTICHFELQHISYFDTSFFEVRCLFWFK